MIVAPALLLYCMRSAAIPWTKLGDAATAHAFRRQLGARWAWTAGVTTVALLAGSLIVPLRQLLFNPRTWSEFPNLFRAAPDTVWNSFGFAATTATICVALGLVTWRFRGGLLLWLLFLIPGVLVGRAMIALFSGTAVYGTAGLVVLAYTLRYLAPAWSLTALARRGVDPQLTEAARVHGAAGWSLFQRVHWPQMAAPVAAAWYATYLLCLWDVETLVLIYPPGGETLALRVFNLLHYGHNAQVNALCLTLLGLAILPLAAWMTARAALVRFVPGRCRLAFGLSALAGGLLLGGCSRSASSGSSPASSMFSDVHVIGSRGTGVGQFTKPRSLALDREDNLFVVDMTGRIQKFSPSGEVLLSWRMPQTDLGKPKGMCRDIDGGIIVVEPHYQRINHFTPDGTLVSQWGESGTNVGRLTLPRSVAVNSHGDIFITEYTTVDRVQSFAAVSHQPLACLGRPGTGNGEFNRAEGIDIGPDDRIYVADSCNHRIQIFSPRGEWMRTCGRAGRALGELSYPYDVKVDRAGRQFVCEFGNSRIQVFDPNGRPLEIVGGPGDRPGQLNNPWAIALDSKGNLYVADAGNHRVVKFVRGRGEGFRF
jgi:ABC-type spermidine/putrescine transport system permease subunit II/DNA-binding beta-propeller fold protein YncE